MKKWTIMLAICVSSIAVPAIGQNVLYYHPSPIINTDIDDMVKDMAAAGASVTDVNGARSFAANLEVEDWDLVLVVDQTVDTYDDDVWDYLCSDKSIQILSTVSGNEVETSYAAGPSRDIQPGVVKEIAQVAVCFAIWVDCRFNLVDGCIVSTPPFTQARVDCDRACDEALSACLHQNAQ